jgi:hypothetical protein
MLTAEGVRSPRFVTADGSKIDCFVKFKELAEEVPFTADANDSHGHGRDIHAGIMAGKAGPIAPYVQPLAAPDPVVQAPPDVVG